ncbi:Sporulation kinase E [Candidatus Brocadiaceae bacterium B188]|nr:PAS domain S-box protein [Candidatus Brocadia sapporoensis]QQR66049.1 MAG: PAS domain S-box protein [Candidatus Brocadia sp.]TWU52963.1 Sporulation kinase E [Candidatus Brocadiaceae bacterium B188]
MFRSIKYKLISLFLIAVLTPLLVMRLIAYPSAQKAIQEATIKNLQLIGSKKVSQVHAWLNELKSNAEHIACNPFVVNAMDFSDTDADITSQFLSHIPCGTWFHKFMISDVSGDVRLSTDTRLTGLNIMATEGFHYALTGKTYISNAESPFFYDVDDYGHSTGRLPAIIISVPIKNKDAYVVGVMMFQAEMSVLNSAMQEKRYGDRYDSYIIDQHGLMITESDSAARHNDTSLMMERPAKESSVVELQAKQFPKSVASCLNGENGFDVNGYINYAGEKVIGVWYWIPELKWGVIAEIRADEVLSAMNNVTNSIFEVLSYLTVTGVILATAGIVFALVIGQKIANPIMELTAATRKMSAGDLSQRVKIHTRDETRELADAFNIMAESVREKTNKLQETSNFLNSILVGSTEHSIIAADLDGTILAFNEGAKRMFGHEPEDLIAKSSIEVLYTKADVKSGNVRKMLETTQAAGRYKKEMHLVRKNGEVFIGYGTVTTRRTTRGEPSGFVMIIRDITEQKLLEQELQSYMMQLEKIVEERTQKLRVSEEKYRRLFETSKDVVFFCDTDCQFIDINQAGVDLFGYDSKNDILKLNLVQHLFFSAGEGKLIKEMVDRNGFIKDYEVELKKKDGDSVPCLMTSNLRRDEWNNIIGYEGIIIDLTERKKIEREKDIMNNINKILASNLDIREVYKSFSEELNKVIDFDRMSITLLDEKREELLIFAVSKDYHNSKLEEGMHYSKYGTLAGKVVENGEVYMVTDTSQGYFLTDPILFKEGIKSRLSFPLICKGEIIGSLNFGSKNVRNYSENHVEIIQKIAPQLAIAIDNTCLFDKIKESEEKYRNLVEDIEDVIFRLDKSGRYLFLNSALKNVTGYDPREFYENPAIAMEMIHKDDGELVRETIRKVLAGELKASKDLEYRIYCKSREELWISQNTYPIKNKKGAIIGIEGIMRDITDSKKIEEQIRRSERLASIGELAASIAHEIRNPLGAISNSVGMLRRDLSLMGDDQKLFDMVVEETDRLNSIISNFLTFAHPAEYHFVRSDILEIIDETLFLLEQDARFHEEIRVVKMYENDIPEIYVDRNWIRKVFWNLLVNSFDAMPRGGKIFIRVRKPIGHDKNEIEIVIADTGIGIPPEIMRKIFEPFFTTKKSKGTGLGLSIVHRIVDNHSGVIDVRSKQNKGTIFTMRLPIKNKQMKAVSV